MKDPVKKHIPVLRRRLAHLLMREYKNSFDLAEIAALEWALLNLCTEKPHDRQKET